MRRLLLLALLMLGGTSAAGQDKTKDLNDALQALKSNDAVERAAGMYFLAQYGKDSKEYSREIVSGLFDSSPDVRMWANKGLPLANPELAGPVLALVQTADYDKRKDAVQALARMGAAGGAAVPALLAFLKGAQPEDRKDVVQALTAVGLKDKQLPAILVALAVKDPDPAVKKMALQGLPKLEEAQLVAQAFGAFLKDPDPAQRAAALATLGNVGKGNQHIDQVLQQGLKDPSPTVREAARVAQEKLLAKK